MSKCMVTTMDNKYNPFTEPEKWLGYDTYCGYNTPGLLAYFANVSSKMDEIFYEEERMHAIDLLLQFNPYGIHMKVYEDEADLLIPLANEAFFETQKTQTA